MHQRTVRYLMYDSTVQSTGIRIPLHTYKYYKLILITYFCIFNQEVVGQSQSGSECLEEGRKRIHGQFGEMARSIDHCRRRLKCDKYS